MFPARRLEKSSDQNHPKAVSPKLWHSGLTQLGSYVSDCRLKRDAVLLARLDNGIGVYRYRYLWSDTVYVGVMAQEVAKITPSAVIRASDGYLRVNYARLGLRMMTWDEWTARRRTATALAA